MRHAVPQVMWELATCLPLATRMDSTHTKPNRKMESLANEINPKFDDDGEGHICYPLEQEDELGNVIAVLCAKPSKG